MNSKQAGSLVELLRIRAKEQAYRVAYSFLVDGEKQASHLSYAELDQQARAIAARLQSLNLQGSRAMLLFPQGLDYIAAFFGCLYAGVIAVPAYPPRNKRHLARLQTIIANSQTSIILSTKTIEHTLDEVFGVDADSSLPILYTDKLSSDPDDWYLPTLYPQDLAFLQYTSGSTSHAKGVMVTHANLMANQRLIKNGFGHNQNSTVVGWLPLYHDMGLIGNVMQPLFIGAPVILMSPMAFLEKPVRWLQAISEYLAHTSGGPNFAFDLCVQKISAAEKSQLDLSSWKLAFNGAEPINAATLDRFSEAFACCGFQREAFYPCYGLAESTLLATGGTKTAVPTVKAFNKEKLELRIASTETTGSEHTRELVGCGTVGIGHQIRIVDPETQIICDNGHIGEIQMSGSSIAQGYWQNSEETAHTFVPDLDNRVWLRTGDLGFIDNSELFVSGRLKDLIIIRGRNYYPHDIETAANEVVDCVTPGGLAAFSMTVDDNEILVLLAELKRSYLRQADFTTEFAEIRKRLVDDCGIQANTLVFIKPGAILKTTSGKIRRSDCKKAFENHQLDIIAVNKLSEETSPNQPANYSSKPDDKQECALRRQNLLLMPLATATKSLVNYLSDKIHRLSGLSKAQMDMSAPVLNMGIDSLKAMELKYFIDDFLAIDFPIALLLDDKSTFEIAEYALGLINVPSTKTSLSDNDSGKRSNQILSHGQQAIWTVCQLEPNTAVYNLPVALRINSEINSEILRDSLRVLINRHEQLRTGYRFDENLPAPILLTQTEPVFSKIICHDEQDRTQRIISEIYHPFNLEKDHKLRTLLLSIGTDNHILLFCAHHIAADFRSLVILLTELKEIYSAQLTGQPFYLPALSAHYTDYSNWQINYLDSQAAKDAWHYWQQLLAGDLPKLQLPYDNTRPLKPSCRGGSETLTIDSKTTEKVHRLAEQYGVTLYMLLLTLFKVLLYRYSGQQDIIVGSPMLGRPKKDFTEAVGYFVNPVAIRSYPEWDKTFIDYLHEVKHTVLGALQYQDYPLSLLVEKLQPERGNGLSPFYDVCFVLQGDATADFDVAAAALGMPDVSLNWPDLNVKTVNLIENIAQFDINLMMAISGKELSASFQYSRDLFEPSTIARMTGHFQTLLQGILDNPSQPLSTLPLLTSLELHRQLIEWNATAAAYPHNTCVHQLFEQQVERSPEAIALVYQGQSLSYDQLNRKANQLAHRLIGLGIHPDERVAICVERSLEMVIGLLGILKAGGAYVPLDPNYPDERLAFMLADCVPVAILTQQALQKQLSNWNHSTTPIITLDAFSNQEHNANLEQAETDKKPKTDSECNPDPITIGLSNQHTAYVIYTSGSTGQPKGVMNAHQGVVNRLWWAQNEYRLDSDDRILQKTPFSFDVSVWEFFLPLLAGAHLIIAKPQGHQDPHYLAELIASAQITTLHFVPSMLQVFLDQADIQKCACLRRVLCSGEALPYALQLRFHQLLSDVELHNLYGPTEAAIDVTSWLCSPEHDLGLVPIGRPIANTQIYILDAQLQPVPMGVSGEIHIGGIGVALGYLGRPELTAERFIDNPFKHIGNHSEHQASARLYKTGDLGRWLPDGSIEYLGRNDFQVKIRGFRIELGEIESRLLQHPLVKEAVVLVKEEQPNDKYLMAYLVTQTDCQLELGDLKSFLKNTLPDYMIPVAVVFLSALPLTANGKLDRKSFLTMGNRGQQRKEYVAPRDEIEIAIAEIWQQILGIDLVGIHDDFFELGGHSLSAIQIITTLKKTYAIDVPVKTLFDAPTIATFVDRVAEYQED